MVAALEWLGALGSAVAPLLPLTGVAAMALFVIGCVLASLAAGSILTRALLGTGKRTGRISTAFPRMLGLAMALGLVFLTAAGVSLLVHNPQSAVTKARDSDGVNPRMASQGEGLSTQSGSTMTGPLRIEYPTKDQHIPQCVTASGTGDVRPTYRLLAYVQDVHGWFWSIGKVMVDSYHHTWKATGLTFGGPQAKVDGVYHLFIVLVPTSSDSGIESNGGTPPPPQPTLPADSVVMDSMPVVRSASLGAGPCA
jgi:hypothetical protein